MKHGDVNKTKLTLYSLAMQVRAPTGACKEFEQPTKIPRLTSTTLTMIIRKFQELLGNHVGRSSELFFDFVC